jgi:hypothetical protein
MPTGLATILALVPLAAILGPLTWMASSGRRTA